MNHLTNDRGRTVIAVGEPGSVERMRVERPALIERLNALYFSAYESHGRAVDEAIEMIRAAGVTDRADTRAILMASHYGEEKAGSVTSLVMSV